MSDDCRGMSAPDRIWVEPPWNVILHDPDPEDTPYLRADIAATREAAAYASGLEAAARYLDGLAAINRQYLESEPSDDDARDNLAIYESIGKRIRALADAYAVEALLDRSSAAYRTWIDTMTTREGEAVPLAPGNGPSGRESSAQAAKRVEVTDAMVERACAHWPVYAMSPQFAVDMRAALEAALNPEGGS